MQEKGKQYKRKHRGGSFFKAVSLLLSITVFLTTTEVTAFTRELTTKTETLSPASRFSPLSVFSDTEEGFAFSDSESLDHGAGFDFTEDVGLFYVYRLVSRILEQYGTRMSASALKDVFSRHLSHVDLTRVLWEDLEKRDNCFLIPFYSRNGEKKFLRFYRTGTYAPTSRQTILPSFSENISVSIEADPREVLTAGGNEIRLLLPESSFSRDELEREILTPSQVRRVLQTALSLGTDEIDEKLQDIYAFRGYNFRAERFLVKLCRLLEKEDVLLRDAAEKAFTQVGDIIANAQPGHESRVLGIAGEISGIYEVAFKRHTSLKNLRISSITKVNPVVLNESGEAIKEFDAYSENSVFEFKFRATLKQIYEQLVGLEQKRTSHLTVLSRPEFDHVRNLVYFGESDGGNLVRAVTEFALSNNLTDRLFLENGAFSAKFDLKEFMGFLFDERVLELVAEESGALFAEDFLSSPTSKEVSRVLKNKIETLEGNHFHVIISVSNPRYEDLLLLPQEKLKGQEASLKRFLTAEHILENILTGSDKNMVWGDNVTPRTLENFHEYLRVSFAGEDESTRKHLFGLLLFSIIKDTQNISAPELLKPLRDLCLLDVRDDARESHASEYKGYAAWMVQQNRQDRGVLPEEILSLFEKITSELDDIRNLDDELDSFLTDFEYDLGFLDERRRETLQDDFLIDGISLTDPRGHDPSKWSYLLHAGITTGGHLAKLESLYHDLSRAKEEIFCTYWSDDEVLSTYSYQGFILGMDDPRAEVLYGGEYRKEAVYPLAFDQEGKTALKEKMRMERSFLDEEEVRPGNEVDVTGATVRGIFVQPSPANLFYQDTPENQREFAMLMAIAVKYELPILLFQTGWESADLKRDLFAMINAPATRFSELARKLGLDPRAARQKISELVTVDETVYPSSKDDDFHTQSSEPEEVPDERVVHGSRSFYDRIKNSFQALTRRTEDFFVSSLDYAVSGNFLARMAIIGVLLAPAMLSPEEPQSYLAAGFLFGLIRSDKKPSGEERSFHRIFPSKEEKPTNFWLRTGWFVHNLIAKAKNIELRYWREVTRTIKQVASEDTESFTVTRLSRRSFLVATRERNGAEEWMEELVGQVPGVKTRFRLSKTSPKGKMSQKVNDYDDRRISVMVVGYQARTEEDADRIEKILKQAPRAYRGELSLQNSTKVGIMAKPDKKSVPIEVPADVIVPKTGRAFYERVYTSLHALRDFVNSSEERKILEEPFLDEVVNFIISEVFGTDRVEKDGKPVKMTSADIFKLFGENYENKEEMIAFGLENGASFEEMSQSVRRKVKDIEGYIESLSMRVDAFVGMKDKYEQFWYYFVKPSGSYLEDTVAVRALDDREISEKDNTPLILFVDELSPSDIDGLTSKYDVQSIVTDKATLTAHWIVYAKQMGIPIAIVDLPEERDFAKELDEVAKKMRQAQSVLDQIAVVRSDSQGRGEILLGPDVAALKGVLDAGITENAFVALLDEKTALRETAYDNVPLGEGFQGKIRLMANVDNKEDMKKAMEQEKAAGIGLLRSEYLFVNENILEPSKKTVTANMPVMNYLDDLVDGRDTVQKRRTELIRHFTSYFKDLSELAGEYPVKVRMMDYEGDKNNTLVHDAITRYRAQNKIKTPLPWGYDFFNDPIGKEVLAVQLESLLFARAEGAENLQLFFPMIDTPDQVEEMLTGSDSAFVRAQTAVAAKIGRNRNIPEHEQNKRIARINDIKKGIMIETDKAIDNIEELVAIKGLDFYNIGTNDLSRFLLRNERGNPRSRDNKEDRKYLTRLQPQVLSAILKVMKTLQAYPGGGKELCICGEMASWYTFMTFFAWAVEHGEIDTEKVPLSLSVAPKRVAPGALFLENLSKEDYEHVNTDVFLRQVTDGLGLLPADHETLKVVDKIFGRVHWDERFVEVRDKLEDDLDLYSRGVMTPETEELKKEENLYILKSLLSGDRGKLKTMSLLRAAPAAVPLAFFENTPVSASAADIFSLGILEVTGLSAAVALLGATLFMGFRQKKTEGSAFRKKITARSTRALLLLSVGAAGFFAYNVFRSMHTFDAHPAFGIVLPATIATIAIIAPVFMIWQKSRTQEAVDEDPEESFEGRAAPSESVWGQNELSSFSRPEPVRSFLDIGKIVSEALEGEDFAGLELVINIESDLPEAYMSREGVEKIAEKIVLFAHEADSGEGSKRLFVDLKTRKKDSHLAVEIVLEDEGRASERAEQILEELTASVKEQGGEVNIGSSDRFSDESEAGSLTVTIPGDVIWPELPDPAEGSPAERGLAYIDYINSIVRVLAEIDIESVHVLDRTGDTRERKFKNWLMHGMRDSEQVLVYLLHTLEDKEPVFKDLPYDRVLELMRASFDAAKGLRETPGEKEQRAFQEIKGKGDAENAIPANMEAVYYHYKLLYGENSERDFRIFDEGMERIAGAFELLEELFEDLRIIEQNNMQALVDGIFSMKSQIAERRPDNDQTLIIGIATGIIPEQQYALSGMQSFLRQIKDLPGGLLSGFKNIEICYGRTPRELAENIQRVRSELGDDVPLSNVAILGERRELENDAFNALRGSQIDSKLGAYFGKVDIPEDISIEGADIDLVALLALFLHRISVSRDIRDIIIYLPDMIQFELGELNRIYQIRSYLLSQA